MGSASETRIFISCSQEHVDALKKAKSPQTKKVIWEAMNDQFQETCQEPVLNLSGKSLAQLTEKWKSLFDKHKAINDNDKATGRGRLTFEFFEEMDSFLGFSQELTKCGSSFEKSGAAVKLLLLVLLFEIK